MGLKYNNKTKALDLRKDGKDIAMVTPLDKIRGVFYVDPRYQCRKLRIHVSSTGGAAKNVMEVDAFDQTAYVSLLTFLTGTVQRKDYHIYSQ